MASALRAAATVSVVAILAAGCGGGSKKSEGGETQGKMTQIAGVSANDHGSKTVGGKAEVELDDYYFEPTVLKGKPGAKVTLELKNEGKEEHNLSIDDQSIDQDVEAGETKTVTVTIPQSGEVSFYCKYHKSKGMAGALEASG
jgi:plastocyanin